MYGTSWFDGFGWRLVPGQCLVYVSFSVIHMPRMHADVRHTRESVVSEPYTRPKGPRRTDCTVYVSGRVRFHSVNSTNAWVTQPMNECPLCIPMGFCGACIASLGTTWHTKHQLSGPLFDVKKLQSVDELLHGMEELPTSAALYTPSE